MRAFLPLAGLIAAIAVGCDSGPIGLIAPASNGLRIATPWPREERALLAKQFSDWLRARPDVNVDAGAIAWVEAADDEPIALASQRLAPAPDVLLGGDVAGHARMAAEGRLESLSDGAPRPYWVVARTSPVDLEVNAARIAPADPRRDPAALAWCLARTASGWRAGYAELLDLYGEAGAVGWRPSSVQVVASGVDSGANYEEGASVIKGTARPRAARAFLNFLEDARGAQLGPEFEAISAAGSLAAERDLAADLLGATLVDAQDELKIAVAAVKAAGSPTWAVERLTQPPPWPPASIEKLLSKPGEEGPALVDALTAQVSPDPGGRDWLARAWLTPHRDLDRPVLAEIARAEGGRLAREPRFRAWLKAEWAQWARQRYRWVARLAAPGAPKPPPSES